MDTAEAENLEAVQDTVLIAWTTEAEPRLDGILAGERKSISGDEVARRVCKSIDR